MSLWIVLLPGTERRIPAIAGLDAHAHVPTASEVLHWPEQVRPILTERFEEATGLENRQSPAPGLLAW